MILDKLQTTVTDSKSILQFSTEGGGNWEVWDRFITIDGKKAFHIGNICETCSFFFERLDGATSSINPNEIVDSLSQGINNLDSEIINKLKLIIPDGKYWILLQKVLPQMIIPGKKGDYFSEEQIDLWGVDGFWGLPHFPKTEYYRLSTKTVNNNRILFEFLIPIFPHSWLDKKQIEIYSTLMMESKLPTAISLSILDDKGPADSNSNITSHWCLSHYLIDGHHKVYSAAQNNRPLTLISFLAIEKGVSTEKIIEDVIKILT